MSNLLKNANTYQNELISSLEKLKDSNFNSTYDSFNTQKQLRQKDELMYSITDLYQKNKKQEIDNKLAQLKDKRKQLLREKQKLRESYRSSQDNSGKNPLDQPCDQQNASEADIGYLLQNLDTSAIDYGSAYLQSNYEYNTSSPLRQIDSMCKQPLDQILKSGFTMNQSQSSFNETTIEPQKSVRFKSPQHEQLKISQLSYSQQQNKLFGTNSNQPNYQKVFQAHAQQKQIYSPLSKQKQYDIKRQMQQFSNSKSTNQLFEQLKSQKPAIPQQTKKHLTSSDNNAKISPQQNNFGKNLRQSTQKAFLTSQAFINTESEIRAVDEQQIDTNENVSSQIKDQSIFQENIHNTVQKTRQNEVSDKQTTEIQLTSQNAPLSEAVPTSTAPTIELSNQAKPVRQMSEKELKLLSDLQAQNQVNLQLRDQCSHLAAQVEALKLQLENQENLTEVERATIALLEQQKEVQLKIQAELKAELQQYQNIEKPQCALLALFNRRCRVAGHDGQLQATIDSVHEVIESNWSEARAALETSGTSETGSRAIQAQRALDRFLVTVSKLAAQEPGKLALLGPDGVKQLFTKIKTQSEGIKM